MCKLRLTSESPGHITPHPAVEQVTNRYYPANCQTHYVEVLYGRRTYPLLLVALSSQIVPNRLRRLLTKSLCHLRSVIPNLTAQRANPLQAGNFGHVSSVPWANGRGLHWNISRARLRILRKPSDGIVPSVFSSNNFDTATHKIA